MQKALRRYALLVLGPVGDSRSSTSYQHRILAEHRRDRAQPLLMTTVSQYEVEQLSTRETRTSLGAEPCPSVGTLVVSVVAAFSLASSSPQRVIGLGAALEWNWRTRATATGRLSEGTAVDFTAGGVILGGRAAYSPGLAQRPEVQFEMALFTSALFLVSVSAGAASITSSIPAIEPPPISDGDTSVRSNLEAGDGMEQTKQPVGTNPEVSRRTLRLTIRSSAKGFELISVEHLPMITPPQPGERPEAGKHGGQWFELRDANNRVLAHRLINPSLLNSVEVHSPDGKIRREFGAIRDRRARSVAARHRRGAVRRAHG